MTFEVEIVRSDEVVDEVYRKLDKGTYHVSTNIKRIWIYLDAEEQLGVSFAGCGSLKEARELMSTLENHYGPIFEITEDTL